MTDGAHPPHPSGRVLHFEPGGEDADTAPESSEPSGPESSGCWTGQVITQGLWLGVVVPVRMIVGMLRQTVVRTKPPVPVQLGVDDATSKVRGHEAVKVFRCSIAKVKRVGKDVEFCRVAVKIVVLGRARSRGHHPRQRTLLRIGRESSRSLRQRETVRQNRGLRRHHTRVSLPSVSAADACPLGFMSAADPCPKCRKRCDWNDT